MRTGGQVGERTYRGDHREERKRGDRSGRREDRGERTGSREEREER